MGPGGYLGGVYRVAIPGTTQPLLALAHPAKRAPEAPSGGWSGWGGRPLRVLGVRRRGRVYPTLRARSVPLQGPSLDIPLECRLWANMARFNVISLEVSQNGQVSPKKCQKASISPCFQNGLKKSPLGILRIPYLAAFSHKELMGRFDR